MNKWTCALYVRVQVHVEGTKMAIPSAVSCAKPAMPTLAAANADAASLPSCAAPGHTMC